ncbi:hypothetical protein L9F63_002035 [Diploptera punctata]|uniref:Ubiquitin carboxyl-terminal hydrolase FAF-X n=1 Tax=Diploptera punctata TaxID=6984 RepID=A0AAD8A2T8_DIPPU|nr:hypothetical protein L9F63_002035 [Diploptera punctata]
MTIATRGQGVVVDPPDGQTSTQMCKPQQSVQPGNGSSIQLSETGVLGGEPSSDQQQINNELIGDDNSGMGGGTEPDFPHTKLALLDDKISSPRWVVPVLPEQELEVLLQASIDLCRKGLDVHSEACQRFFREGLTISFTKILTDDAVNSWKFNIHHCILQNCERLVELCVVKLNQDWFPLLDLLAMVFNPNNKFHTFNGSRPSETVPSGSNIPDEELYARLPPDSRTPRGWLVDLINRFGTLGGFQILLEKISEWKKSNSLSDICTHSAIWTLL